MVDTPHLPAPGEPCEGCEKGYELCHGWHWFSGSPDHQCKRVGLLPAPGETSEWHRSMPLRADATDAQILARWVYLRELAPSTDSVSPALAREFAAACRPVYRPYNGIQGRFLADGAGDVAFAGAGVDRAEPLSVIPTADEDAFFKAFTERPCTRCGGQRNWQIDGQLQAVCFRCSQPDTALPASPVGAARTTDAEMCHACGGKGGRLGNLPGWQHNPQWMICGVCNGKSAASPVRTTDAEDVEKLLFYAYRYDDKPHQFWNQCRIQADKRDMIEEAREFHRWYLDSDRALGPIAIARIRSSEVR